MNTFWARIRKTLSFTGSAIMTNGDLETPAGDAHMIGIIYGVPMCVSTRHPLKKNLIIERRNESLYSGTNPLFPYAQQDSIGTGATSPNLLKHSRHVSFYRTCLNHPALLALKKKLKN